MYKFYLLLWVRWVSRLTICSVFLAMALSFFITIGIYFLKGAGNLDTTTLNALFDIWKFWVMVSWNLTILIALFRSLKYIFNNCLNGYRFRLFQCDAKDSIEFVGYGDLPKVFRRWLFSLIWLVASFVIISFIIGKLFLSIDNIFEWFNIYWLYMFLILSGFISFTLLPTLSKRVRLSLC